MSLFHLVNILVFVRVQTIKYVFVFWFLEEPKFWDKHKKRKRQEIIKKCSDNCFHLYLFPFDRMAITITVFKHSHLPYVMFSNKSCKIITEL